MAFQNLGYRIDVNDAELRLATQHVAAFNAEVAASTVTGRKFDTQLRSIGRRAAQVGAFFTRSLTLPIGLIGLAAGKVAGEFETQFAKIEALTNTSAAGVERLKKAALDLSSKIITEGPEKLGEAFFFERSAGFSLEQSLKSIVPIAKAAAAGLGPVAVVADAVANALDAFGIAGSKAATRLSISASQAVAILIGTVAQGKVATDQLAGSIGRVIPIANALGITFDQVGASIATMTRQGLNANLAVTGLRALFQTFSKAQPQTEKALATIGTSAEAVRQSLASPKIGVFSTLIALRREFDKKSTQPLKLSTEDLTAALGGEAEALAKIKTQIGEGNEALAKLFPNVRALTAFLIITGPRQQQNATIFARLKMDAIDSANVIQRAYEAKAKTAIGRFQLAISQLKAELVTVGPTFINAATGIIAFFNGIVQFFEKLGPLGGVFKNVAIGLALFGPLVLLFGRATQAASFGVTMWGRWQTAATEAAFKVKGINIAEDQLVIETRKATVVFEESMNRMSAAAGKTAAAVSGIAAATGKVTGATAAASSGVAALGRIKGRAGLTGRQRTAAGAETAVAPALAAASLANPAAAQAVDSKVARLQQAQREAQKASAELTAAQARGTQFGISARQSGAEAAAQRLVKAQEEIRRSAALVPAAVLRSSEAVASAEASALAATERLTGAEAALAAAQQRQAKFNVSARAAGVEAAQAEIVAINEEIARREAALLVTREQLALERERAVQALASSRSDAVAFKTRQLLANTTPQGLFVNIKKRDAAIAQSARIAADSNVRAARISATAWQTAMVGIKSAGALAFDFIALTFAANLLGKVVFDSHHTKEAVTRDLFDIHKAGVGAASAVALIASVGLPKLISAFGKIRGGVGAFEALGIATLGWRAKIALTLVAVLGLQQAGIKLEQVFNAVFLGLAVRAAVTSTLVRTAIGGIAVRAGLAELAASVGAVTLAFGAWPIAIGVAAAVILAQTPPIKRALDEINDGFESIGKSIDDLNGKGGGHFFQDFFKHGLFAKGGVHPFGIGLGPSGDDLRRAKGVTGETDKQKKSTAEMQADAQAFAELIKGLPPAVQQAATELHKGGKDFAADQLIATARAKEQFAQVKAAVALFKREGKPGIARILGDSARALKETKAALDAQFKGIEDSILKAFDVHTDSMLRVFDRQTDNITRAFDQKTSDILQTFDRQTQKLEDKLKIKVTVPKLNETFTVTVNGKTPAERELEALDKLQAKRNFQRDLFDANKGLTTALQIGDPQAIREAERARQDAVTEKRRFELQARAEKERAAADKAIPVAQQKFEDQRTKLRRQKEETRRLLEQTITDGRDILRRNLEAQRAVEKDQVESAINAEIKLFNNGKINLKKFLADVLALMRTHNLSSKQLGVEGGKAYATQLSKQLDGLQAKVDKALDGVTASVRRHNKVLEALAKDFGRNFAAIINPGVPGQGSALAGVLGQPSPVPPDPTNRNPQQKAANQAGRPTRTAIIQALRLANSRKNIPKSAIYELDVPKRGRPTEREYQKWLRELDPDTRKRVRGILHNEGFFKAAGGGVVPADSFHHDRNERLFVLPGRWPGMLKRGNLDLLHRPDIKNPAGGRSSVLSTSWDVNGREVLMPQVLLDPPRIVSARAALAHFMATGENLGIFDNPKHANLYASALHRQQAALGRRGATGMAVPGFGSGDTVHALLTPNEIVLNARHQEWMKRALGIGGNAHGLFNFIDRMAGGTRRFATGGVVDPGSGGKGLGPILPGFDEVKDAIKDLINALTKNAVTVERNSQNTKLLKELVSGGRTVIGADGKKHFVKDTDEQRDALRRKFDPHISVEKMLRDPRFAGLSPEKRAELRAKIAQIEAHPVSAGLITATPTGVKPGGTQRLKFSDGPVSVQSRGSGGDGTDVGGGMNIEHLEIHVNGADDPKKVAAEVRRELLKTAKRNTAQRRGRHAGTTIGAR